MTPRSAEPGDGPGCALPRRSFGQTSHRGPVAQQSPRRGARSPLVLGLRPRDPLFDPTAVTNGSQGPWTIRRKLTNNTGQTIPLLRVRTSLPTTTFPQPAGMADLRLLSPDETVTVAARRSRCWARGSRSRRRTRAAVANGASAPCGGARSRPLIPTRRPTNRRKEACRVWLCRRRVSSVGATYRLGRARRATELSLEAACSQPDLVEPRP